MKYVYLICPVRKCDSETKESLDEYVRKLENQGIKCHYPPRDVDQLDDGIGFELCDKHRREMEKCDEVHVWWNSISYGSYFDLGMAFALNKPIVLANFVPITETKSYTNILIYLSGKNLKEKDCI